MCVSYSVKYIYVHTYIEYIYREIKEIRTQLSIAAYLFASPKQHVDPARPSASPPNSSKCYPQCRRLLDFWVLGNILCKLQVKCENSSDWFNSAMPTKMLGLESRAAGLRKGSGKKKEKQLRKLQKQQKISRTGNSKY